MSDGPAMSELEMLRVRGVEGDNLAAWAAREIETQRKVIRFAYDIADEELPHCRVGTGAEVALRHIRRKASDALHIP